MKIYYYYALALVVSASASASGSATYFYDYTKPTKHDKNTVLFFPTDHGRFSYEKPPSLDDTVFLAKLLYKS